MCLPKKRVSAKGVVCAGDVQRMAGFLLVIVITVLRLAAKIEWVAH